MTSPADQQQQHILKSKKKKLETERKTQQIKSTQFLREKFLLMAAAVQAPLNGHNTSGLERAGNGEIQPKAEQAETKEVDIVINNVVSSFNVRCHLNLRDIALNGLNVEYRKENGMVTMKLRHPYTTASIWSSGKITCTGANSEEQARVAARRFARVLQKLGFNTRFKNYRVVNVLGTVTLPFAINIINFSQAHAGRARLVLIFCAKVT